MKAQLLTLVLCAACASVKGSTKEEKREFIDKFAEDSLVRLYEAHPKTEAELKGAPGYGVFKKTITKVPLIGAGGGYGVVVDNKTKARTYVKVREFQLGAGYGAKSMSTVVIFDTSEVMDKVRKGTWRIGASAGASAGDKGACGAAGGEGFTPYVFNDKGAAVTATFNMLRVKTYGSLNKK